MTPLTWLDVAKLCVPFLFSLVLIWAKEMYEKRRERIAKQKFLWKTITQATPNLFVALTSLEKTSTAFKENRIRIVEFDIPTNLSEFGNRLGELDPANAYIYSDYTSQIEIVRKGVTSLTALIGQYLSKDDDTSRERISKAISAQATNLKKDLIILAEREHDLLNMIRTTNKWARSYPQQPIDQLSAAIKKAEASFPSAGTA